MAERALSNREKNLLWLCLGVLVLMASAVLGNVFLGKRKVVLERLTSLQQQKEANEQWLNDRAYWDKHSDWLEKHMPTTESLSRSQAKLLEELQAGADAREIRLENPELIPAVTTADYREVAVSMRLSGEQTILLQWLTTLQSPETFQVIKVLDFEIDTRSKEPKPQGRCNLTVARWFKAEVGT